MGFTTGLLGGFTLTASALYLSVSYHQRSRLQQGILLQQQALLLHHIVDPPPLGPPPTEREVKAGLLETAKDKWNSRLERDVNWLLTKDWDETRDYYETLVGGLFRRAFAKAKEVTQDATKP